MALYVRMDSNRVARKRRFLEMAAHIALVSLTLSVTACRYLPEPKLEGPFQVPAGFVVEAAASPEQVGSLIQFTFDSFGRPVVSKERGHPTLLLDLDNDGFFESEKVFSDKVKNLQGLWFDGPVLYAIGNDAENGQAGLYRLEDIDGDDVADTFEMLNVFDGRMGEHGPHDIRRGPDGQPTILIGNASSVPASLIDADSPLLHPQGPASLADKPGISDVSVSALVPGGAIFQLNRKTKTYTALVGGFRNPYNHAYNWEGELFTFDSDAEGDLNLPWYRAIRSVHAVPGGDYGWRQGFGKLPSYSIDTLPPLNELGRGSPVGLDFYHHYAYPEEYFDTFLQGDWSRGRILASKYAAAGASYQLTEPPFDFVYGEPLNVTDLEVGPDGFVYFTMGGRDTQGGFYRVAYRGRRPNWAGTRKRGIMVAVRQPQPLSSWGHAALLGVKDAMQGSWVVELEKLARNSSAETRDRVQTLFLLLRLGPQPSNDLLKALASDSDARVRAAAVYVAQAGQAKQAAAIVARAVGDEDPFVRRRAAEALAHSSTSPDESQPMPTQDTYRLLQDQDRFVRYAGRLALERAERDLWAKAVLEEEIPAVAVEGLLALTRTAKSGQKLAKVLQKITEVLESKDPSAETTLGSLRLFHLACSKQPDGCAPEHRRQMHRLIVGRFPADDDRLNTEYARTLAYCGQPEAIDRILEAMPPDDTKQPLQVHYAYCLQMVKTGWTPEQKRALLTWFTKARQWRGGALFLGAIHRLFDSSMEFFDEGEKKQAYTEIPEFAPVQEGGNYSSARRRRARNVSSLTPQEVFEYMMYDPMTLKADPQQGKRVFDESCGKCHRFGPHGKDYGPDLTTLTNRFRRSDIIEAVLWPSKTISDQYKSWIVETHDNQLYYGLLLSQDGGSITLHLPEEQQVITIQESDIKNQRVSQVSTMPEGLLDGYSRSEIVDLFAYIEKGP